MRVTAFINYTTRQGDTFDELALQLYNNEMMAHHIIQFNPDYADVVVFDEAVALRLPIMEDAAPPSTLPPWRTDE